MRANCCGSVALGLLVLAGVLRADDQADARAVIDKALKAMGGAAKVARLKAAACKCKVSHETNGQQATLVGEALWQGTDKARLGGELTQGGTMQQLVFVINGDKGWRKRGDQVGDAPEAVLSTIKDAFYAMQMVHLLPDLKDAAFQLSPLGEVKVNDKAAVGIAVTHKDHKDVSVYFDKDTGLPVKSEARMNDPTGKEITVEFHYSDFQDTDGVKHPRKISIKADGREITLELSEVKAKDKIDDSEFARP